MADIIVELDENFFVAMFDLAYDNYLDGIGCLLMGEEL